MKKPSLLIYSVLISCFALLSGVTTFAQASQKPDEIAANMLGVW